MKKKKRKKEKQRIENLFVNDFSSTVYDVILQEQKDRHVNATYQLPCLKMKFVHSSLLCIQSIDEKQSLQIECMELFVVTYKARAVLARPSHHNHHCHHYHHHHHHTASTTITTTTTTTTSPPPPHHDHHLHHRNHHHHNNHQHHQHHY